MKRLAVPVLILLLAIPALPAPSAQPVPGEDWIVSEDTVLSNETILMDGNLTVKSGVRLELDNITLCFNSTSLVWHYYILVEKGAFMKMNICILNQDPSTQGCYFWVFGELVLERTAISMVYDGIRFQGGEGSITGCDLASTGGDEMIDAVDTPLLIKDSSFHQSYYGVYTVNSTISVANTSFDGPGIGASAHFCTADITHCTFVTAEDWNADLVFEGCNVAVEDCRFASFFSAGPAGYDKRPQMMPQRKGDLTVQGCDINCAVGCDINSWYSQVNVMAFSSG
jgi:hypothetical protein